MSHHVRMFKPQFAALVESGAKSQTVRPTPKRMPKAGDTISLRVWTGKPYRSKQRVLREAVVTSVHHFWFNGVTILIDDRLGERGLPTAETQESFARADGFENLRAMSDWFEAENGLPFEGLLIKWTAAHPLK